MRPGVTVATHQPAPCQARACADAFQDRGAFAQNCRVVAEGGSGAPRIASISGNVSTTVSTSAGTAARERRSGSYLCVPRRGMAVVYAASSRAKVIAGAATRNERAVTYHPARIQASACP